MSDPTLALAAIMLAAVGSQILAARFRLPAIIPLLVAGVLLGPYVLDAFDPDNLLGNLLDPFVSLAVGAILFDGALTLRREQLGHGVGSVVIRLISLGVALTWGLAAGGAALLMGVDHRIALLLGAVLTLSGPTVVVPLLDYVRPTARPDAALRWEGILVDPIGAILAVLVYHAVASGDGGFEPGEFTATVTVGIAVGLAGAALLGVLLSRRRFESHLEATATLAVVLFSVAVASELREDAGLVTAIVMGLALAARRREIVERAPEFSGTLVSLLLGVLFVVLSARVDPQAVIDLGLGGLAFVGLLVLVVRPLSAVLCTWRTQMTPPERGLIAWMMPRGIVAAATASAFELGLRDNHIPDAAVLVPATFLVIAATVVIYGLTARPLALALGVAEREPPS
ncbi:MAG: cation:proton antiporter [bacterium]